MKRLLGLFLAFIALFTLASCGSFGGGGNAGPNPDYDKPDIENPDYDKPVEEFTMVILLDENGNVFFEEKYHSGIYLSAEDLPRLKSEEVEFEGWDYDFSLPLMGGELVISPIYKHIDRTHEVVIDLGYDGLVENAGVAYNESYDFSYIYREGYELKGFEFDGNDFPISGIYNYKEDIRITAIWEKTTIKITYVGVDASNNPDTLHKGEEDVALNDPFSYDAIFKGWYLEPEFKTKVTKISFSDGDITLYANMLIPGRISYDLNGVKCDNFNPTEFINKEAVTLKEPSGTEYEFLGWYLDKEYTKPVTVLEPSEDITVYAKWNLTEYNITINLNGATASFETSLKAIKGQYISLYDTPTLKGHNFRCYEIEGNEYSYGFVFNFDHDIVVNAIFDKKVIHISYQNATEFTSEQILEYEYGTKLELPEGISKGYNFVGWYLDYEYNVAFEGTDKMDSDFTIYAKFEPKEYTITLDSLCDDVLTTQMVVKTGDMIDLPYKLQRAGYELEGWYFDKEYQERASYIDSYNLTKDFTVYAKWTALRYTIYVNNAYYYKDSFSVVFGEKIEFPNYTKDWYDFKGYTLDGEAFTDEIYKIPHDIELDVAWAPHVYDVIYEHDGTLSGEYSKSFTIEDNYITLPKVTLKGHTLLNWSFGEKTFKEKLYFSSLDPIPLDESLTLKANLNANEYSIHVVDEKYTFYVDVTYGEAIDFSNVKKTGYEIEGFYYSNGTKFIDTIYTLEENIELNVKFIALKYKATYVLNGGEFIEPSAPTLQVDIKNDIKSPIKDGFDFAGWYFDEAFTTPYSDEKFAQNPSDISLYAKWDNGKHTIFVISNVSDGSFDLECVYNEEFTLDYKELPGYKFVGFMYNGEPFVNRVFNYKNSIIVEAVYEKIIYNISYDFTDLGGKLEYANYPTNVSYNQRIKLPQAKPNNPSYTFAAWVDSEGNEYKEISYLTKDLDLRATYIYTSKINVTTNLSGERYIDNPNGDLYHNEEMVLLPAYLRGYKFIGWYLNDALVDRLPANLNSDVDLVAKFELATYNVTYNLNFGDNGSVVLQLKHLSHYTSAEGLKDIVNPGYIMKCVLYNGEEKYYFQEANDITVDIVWELEVYNIMYSCSHLEFNHSNPSSFTVNDEIILTDASFRGARFIGWKDEEGSYITKIEKGTNRNIHLIAVFDNAENIITLDYGYDGIKEVINLHYSTIYKPKNITREGYNFIGWYDRFDNYVPLKEGNFTGNTILKAKWEKLPNTYIITLTGASLLNNEITVTENEVVKLPIPNKDNEKFDGWYYNNERLPREFSYTYGMNITLEARFVSVSGDFEYKVANGGAVITRYTGGSICVIPSYLGSYKVLGIEDYAITSGKVLDKLVIGEFVKNINRAFFSNIEIKEIVILSTELSGKDLLGMQRNIKKITLVCGFKLSVLFDNLRNVYATVEVLPNANNDFSDIVLTFTNVFEIENIIIAQGITNLKASYLPDMVENLYLPKGFNELEVSNVFNITNIHVKSIYDFLAINIKGGTVVNEYNIVVDGMKLENVVIPDSIVELKPNQFAGSTIVSVDLNKVKTIGAGAFRDCNKIKDLILSEYTLSIGEEILDREITNLGYRGTKESFDLLTKNTNTYLNNIIFITPEFTHVKENGYEYNLAGGYFIYDLKVVNTDAVVLDLISSFPNKRVVTLAHDAFDDLMFVDYVLMPTSIHNVNKTSLDIVGDPHIYYQGDLRTLKENGFMEIDIKNMHYNSTYDEIVYVNDGVFEYVKLAKEVVVYKFISNEINDIDMNDYFTKEGVSVSFLMPGVFEESSVIRVVLPDTITYIPSYTFKYTKCLNEVVIGSSVNVIKSHAFDFSSIRSISIPGNVKTIEEKVFENSSLNNIILNEGVESIGAHAFYKSNISKLYVPTTLKFIYEQDHKYDTYFKNYESLYQLANYREYGDNKIFVNDVLLTKVTLTANDNLAHGTFFYYNALKEVNITGGASIGYSVFEGTYIDKAFVTSIDTWVSLKLMDSSSNPAVYTPNKVFIIDGKEVYDVVIKDKEILGEKLFANMNITSLKLEGNIKEIGYSFAYNSKISTLELSNSISVINKEAFSSCKNLKSVVLPSSLTAVSDYCFAYCENLTSVTLNEGLETINQEAFYLSGLTSIKLPSTLLYIGDMAFADTNIKDVVLNDKLIDCNTRALPKELNSIYIGEAYNGFAAFQSDIVTIKVSSKNKNYRSTNLAGVECNMVANKECTILEGAGILAVVPNSITKIESYVELNILVTDRTADEIRALGNIPSTVDIIENKTNDSYKYVKKDLYEGLVVNDTDIYQLSFNENLKDTRFTLGEAYDGYTIKSIDSNIFKETMVNDLTIDLNLGEISLNMPNLNHLRLTSKAITSKLNISRVFGNYCLHLPTMESLFTMEYTYIDKFYPYVLDEKISYAHIDKEYSNKLINKSIINTLSFAKGIDDTSYNCNYRIMDGMPVKDDFNFDILVADYKHIDNEKFSYDLINSKYVFNLDFHLNIKDGFNMRDDFKNLLICGLLKNPNEYLHLETEPILIADNATVDVNKQIINANSVYYQGDIDTYNSYYNTNRCKYLSMSDEFKYVHTSAMTYLIVGNDVDRIWFDGSIKVLNLVELFGNKNLSNISISGKPEIIIAGENAGNIFVENDAYPEKPLVFFKGSEEKLLEFKSNHYWVGDYNYLVSDATVSYVNDGNQTYMTIGGYKLLFKNNDNSKVVDLRAKDFIAIMNGAFSETLAIEELYLPESLVYLCPNSLNNLSSLKALEMPLHDINCSLSFEGTNNLVRLKAPSCVVKIINTDNLVKLTIGKSENGYINKVLPKLEDLVIEGEWSIYDLTTPMLKTYSGDYYNLLYILKSENQVYKATVSKNYSFSDDDDVDFSKIKYLKLIGDVYIYNDLRGIEALDLTEFKGDISYIIEKSNTKFVIANFNNFEAHNKLDLNYSTFLLDINLESIEYKENEQFKYAVINNSYVAVLECKDKMLTDVDLNQAFTLPVIAIAPRAFMNMNELANVTLNDELKFIGRMAFMNDTKLLGMTFPSSLEVIGKYAFADCDSLTEVNISSENIYIDSAFVGNDRLGSVEITSTNAYLYSAFIDCKRILRVKILNAITGYENAIKGSENIKYAEVSANALHEDSQNAVEDLILHGEYAYFNGTNLKTLKFVDTKNIFANAFDWCYSLTSVDLGSVEAIGESAFSNCINLRDVKFGDKLRNIGRYAFSSTGLKEVNINTPIYKYEYTFSGCKNLEIVNLASSETYIGTLTSCPNLKIVTLGSDAKTIYNIFEYSKVGYFKIPANAKFTYNTSDYFSSATIRILDIPKSATLEINSELYAQIVNYEGTEEELRAAAEELDFRYFQSIDITSCTYEENADYRYYLVNNNLIYNLVGVLDKEIYNIVEDFKDYTVISLGEREHSYEKIKKLYLPDGVKYVGNNIFDRIEELHIESIDSFLQMQGCLKYEPFKLYLNGEQVRRIEIPKGLKYVPEICRSLSGMEEIILNEGLESAYINMPGLNKVILNEGFTKIPYIDAAYNQIVIPSTIKEVSLSGLGYIKFINAPKTLNKLVVNRGNVLVYAHKETAIEVSNRIIEPTRIYTDANEGELNITYTDEALRKYINITYNFTGELEYVLNENSSYLLVNNTDAYAYKVKLNSYSDDIVVKDGIVIREIIQIDGYSSNDVHIPEGVEYISMAIISNIDTLYLPKSIKNIDIYDFYNQLYTIKLAEGNEFFTLVDNDKLVDKNNRLVLATVDCTIIPDGIVEIMAFAVSNNNPIYLPRSVKKIAKSSITGDIMYEGSKEEFEMIIGIENFFGSVIYNSAKPEAN